MLNSKCLSVGLISLGLISCSTTKVLNNSCRVHSSQKIADKSIKPSDGTLDGFIAGGVSGIIIGGFAGGLTGAALSVGSFGFYAPLIPGFIIAGAAGGGVIGGIIGISVGYTYDYFNAGAGTYNYKVYCDISGEIKYTNKQNSINNKIESMVDESSVYNVIQISDKPFNNSESVILKFNKDKLFIIKKEFVK